MSKRRQSNPQLVRYIKSSMIQQKTPQKRTRLTHKHHSFVERTRHRTIKTEISLQEDQKLQSLFNKNISKYRDLINSNDKSVLPFISSLRQSQNISKICSKPQKTKVEPFAVADKSTCNQKIHKDLNDIKGRTKRISNALYRWHNNTGLSTKNSCFFQSKLRQTSMKFHNKDTFLNLFSPIEKKIVEQKRYREHELVCAKQKRLFTLQN